MRNRLEPDAAVVNRVLEAALNSDDLSDSNTRDGAPHSVSYVKNRRLEVVAAAVFAVLIAFGVIYSLRVMRPPVSEEGSFAAEEISSRTSAEKIADPEPENDMQRALAAADKLYIGIGGAEAKKLLTELSDRIEYTLVSDGQRYYRHFYMFGDVGLSIEYNCYSDFDRLSVIAVDLFPPDEAQFVRLKPFVYYDYSDGKTMEAPDADLQAMMTKLMSFKNLLSMNVKIDDSAIRKVMGEPDEIQNGYEIYSFGSRKARFHMIDDRLEDIGIFDPRLGEWQKLRYIDVLTIDGFLQYMTLNNKYNSGGSDISDDMDPDEVEKITNVIRARNAAFAAEIGMDKDKADEVLELLCDRSYVPKTDPSMIVVPTESGEIKYCDKLYYFGKVSIVFSCNGGKVDGVYLNTGDPDFDVICLDNADKSLITSSKLPY